MERKAREVRYSTLFLKHVARLPKRIIILAKEKERIFRNDMFDPRLQIHKLHGKEKIIWAFWINRIYRIKFVFLTEETVLFLDIGTHRIYKN
jgi:plasmid maintenance system killer protein